MRWDEDAIARENRRERFINVECVNDTYIEKYEDGSQETFVPFNFPYYFIIRDLNEETKINLNANVKLKKLRGKLLQKVRHIGTEKYYDANVEISSENVKNSFSYLAELGEDGAKRSAYIHIGLDNSIIEDLVETISKSKVELQLVIEVEKDFIFSELENSKYQNYWRGNVELSYWKHCDITEHNDASSLQDYYRVSNMAKTVSAVLEPISTYTIKDAERVFITNKTLEIKMEGDFENIKAIYAQLVRNTGDISAALWCIALLLLALVLVGYWHH